MRKVNSKATLQPNNSGNGSSIGLSPSTMKQHSMIKLYKVQTGNPNQQTKLNVNIQPSTIIAKNIQARRMQNNNITNQPIVQNRTNHNITMMIGQDQNNNSVQTVKPSTIFSPGDTIQRKNLDLASGTVFQKLNNNNQQWDKQSPLARQKLFTNPDYNSVGPKTNELYNNMRKQLEKQRSLQSLFNSTQKVANQSTLKHQNSTTQINSQQPKTSRNLVQQSNTLENQRQVIRRGSKYQGNISSTGFVGAYHTQHNSIMNNSHNPLNSSQRSINSNSNSNNPTQQQMFMFKNNLTNMTRNKSAFLNFNSTQPVPSQTNKTQIDLTQEERKQVLIEKTQKLHNQSPSVSSDEEKKGSVEPLKMKDFNTNIEKSAVKLEVKKVIPNLGSHQKKRSQLPHGSFIETKMKNCLHSRNADTSAHAYQTYQGAYNQKALLQKNQSQPNLYPQKNINLTQRTTFVKTSFLRHDDSRSVTPMNAASSKSPNGHSTKDDKMSTKSKTKPIQGLKGDMKSLNLSPIVPQNFGKNKTQFQREPSHSDYQKSNIASAQKRLEMRKGSVNSNHNNKPFSSLKKDRSALDINKQQTSIRDEPTTEKKTIKKDLATSNAKKYLKPGYSSQETERGPGGTNSYSTTDDINLISNEFHSKYILRFKNDGSQTRKMFQNDKIKPQYQGQFTEGIAIQEDSIYIMKQQAPIFDKTQESKIKVNQILNNNNLSQTSNRYNINLNPDNIYLPPSNKKESKSIQQQQQTHKTPRNLPFLSDDTINYESQQFNKQNKFIIPQSDEDQLTQKKTKQYEQIKSDSSFEDDMVNEKDFEEFDRAEKSHESQNSLKVRVQIIDQDSIFRDVKTQPNPAAASSNALHNYNIAANNLNNHYTAMDTQNGNGYNNYYYQKDDRNSLVNYDTSLLTHNTGRDNDSSPISEIRDARKNKQQNFDYGKQQQKAKNQGKGGNDFQTLFPDANSFIAAAVPIQDKTVEQINTKTDDGYCDDQIFEQYQDDYHDANTQFYKNIMIQLQKEEEKEIEKVTQQTLISQKYRLIKNDKEKAKYLSGIISSIRNKYKQLLIEKVLAHQ